MSKDFKKEYRELAQNEIPDLWNRIEARLTEKTSSPNSSIEAASEPAPAQSRSVKSHSGIIIFLKRYAGLAAAVLCVAFIIPFLMQSDRMGKSTSSLATEEVMEEAVAEAAADTEAVQEESLIPEEAEEMSVEEGEEERAAGTEAAAEELSDAGLENAAIEDTADLASSSGAVGKENQKAQKEAAFRTEADSVQASSSPAEGQDTEQNAVLKDITIRVIAEDNSMNGGDAGRKKETGYQAVVISDLSGTLAQEEEIKISLPADFDLQLQADRSYKADLVWESEADGTASYLICRIVPLEK